mgnify:CR=1 FL=1
MAGNSRRIVRIVAVVGVAAATGYFMQADKPAARVAATAPTPAPAQMVPSVAARAAEVAPLQDARTAAAAPAAPVEAPGLVPVAAAADVLANAIAVPVPPAAPAITRQAAIFGMAEAATVAPAAEPAAEPAPLAETPAEPPACLEALDVVAAPGAMLTAVLTAPCRAGERVVLRHAGLAVTAQVTEAGTLTATIPAFDPAGAVTVQFVDGRRADGAAPVADLAGTARFAVQWMAGDAFHLHAFAAGAAFGSAGHVHAGAPGTRGDTAGYILSLGDPALENALLAEVYTFPADRGPVALDLEAPITAATCGREMLGETLQWADGILTLRDLTVEMPDCGEGDGFLLLQNPMADLTLAAN